jgi:hypothetical protein
VFEPAEEVKVVELLHEIDVDPEITGEAGNALQKVFTPPLTSGSEPVSTPDKNDNWLNAMLEILMVLPKVAPEETSAVTKILPTDQRPNIFTMRCTKLACMKMGKKNDEFGQ